MNQNLVRIVIVACGVGLAFGFAGCKGIPTPGERAARHLQRDTAAQYRPDQHKLPLPALTNDSPLADFLAYSMLNAPKIEAAYYDWVASIEKITTARSRPDPQLTFQMDIQNIVTSVMPGFMMNLPGAGKLRANAEVASAESQAKYFIFQASILETAFAVKQACYQLHFLDEKIRLNHNTLSLLSELEELARAQNEVGKVTLQDVLRAQIEQGRVRTELQNLEDSRGPLLMQLKAALGMGIHDPIPPVPRRPDFVPLDPDPDALLTTLLATNTRLRSLTAEVQAAEAAIAAASKASRPDFSVGLMADAKMSPVLYRPLATISLPVWRDKIAAQIAEAQANKNSASARLSAEQISLAADFAAKAYLYREATRTLNLLQRDLLPRQRQSLEVARSGYLSGQIDFFNLTDAEQTLLRFGLAEVDARAQRELTMAEISMLLAGMPSTTGSFTSGPRANVNAESGVRATSMNTMK